MGLWKKYVPVGERIAKGKRKMNQLKKKGKVIEPIEIEGRTIAKEFWGKKWNQHLETFSDYSNRLPRGRSYVRNGSVCHLEMKKGAVEAFVSGSRSSPYEVKIDISLLEKRKWAGIKKSCQGEIGSLLELLNGKISSQVMKVACDHKKGLFPKEGEIQFSCTCPDWAGMCKHVAAVLYGIGSRLDKRPDLLFLLRGVNPNDLIKAKLNTSTSKTDGILEQDELSDIFDIDLE